jgi:hypothetical protein
MTKFSYWLSLNRTQRCCRAVKRQMFDPTGTADPRILTHRTHLRQISKMTWTPIPYGLETD